uniref:Putative pogo family transposase ixodes scapularis pogo family transposase n=1 Tax=Ixodes ricinus TaxID=34613 RepID=A0A147BAS4_IXORI
MRVGTNECQKLPSDYAEAIAVSREAVSTLRREHDYTDYNIANMDQTMVRMDCPATRTNNTTGDSTIRITNTGCARRGMTVALCATAAGVKLPALIVLKEPTGRIPPRALFALKIPGMLFLNFLYRRYR